MTWQEYKIAVYADLYRIEGRASWWLALRYLLPLFGLPGYKVVFWGRLRSCMASLPGPARLLCMPLVLLIAILHVRYMLRFGIAIPHRTAVGPGLYVGHYGCIVVNGQARIGKNCNLSQGVTIGQANRGKRKGYPVIGDNVYIGPGAKVIGKVTVGSNVAIGANAVVIDDVPDCAMVVGVPGRIVSMNGAEGYVDHIDWEPAVPAEQSMNCPIA